MGGTIFHSSTWVQYVVAASPRMIPQYLTLVTNENEVVGSALGFLHSSQHKVLAHFSKRLWFDALPVIKDAGKDLLSEFLQLLTQHANDSGIVELSLGSYASPCDNTVLEKLGFKLDPRLEFELPLGLSEDDLWVKLGAKRRNQIRKAIKVGVTIHDISTEEGILELRRLQAESARRILKRGGPHIASIADAHQDPVRILLRSGLGQIRGARFEGAFVSAVLFTYFNGLVYDTLSGHAREGLEFQAPSLLLWESTKHYRAEGATRFSLGGCKREAVNRTSSEHGVYTFKKSFGTECLECTSGRKIFRPTTYRTIETAKSILGR